MAEEPQKPAADQVVAAVPVPVPEPQPQPQPHKEEETQPDKPTPEPEPEPEAEAEVAAAAADHEEAAVEEGKNQIAQSVSFKEETNVVGDLPEAQKKALDDLKNLIQEALNKHELSASPTAPNKEEVTPAVESDKPEEPKPQTAADEAPKEAEAEPAQEEKKEVLVVAGVLETTAAAAAPDEDGAKTVEAIEESVVSAVAVSPPPPDQEAAAPPTTTKEKEVEAETSEVTVEVAADPEEVEIWGIPLLADERSDVVLLKFLRARDFKVKDAFSMIRNTVRWRKEFGIEALVEEDLGKDWDKVVFNQGYDKEGHPVCYNVFGEFEEKELYQKTYSDEEKRQKFIRWRIQFLEKSVRKLDFTPKGISTIVQVNDLKNSPGLTKRDLRLATNQALQLLQDNYPEFVAKQVFINVPWWYLAFSRMISAFLTQRTKSKFVFAGPSKSADTLFKYIAPEQVPVQYGGLSREGDQEFTTADPVTEVTIKPATKHTVEFPFAEKSHLVWELRVLGWDVSYGAEFVPSAEDGYTVLVQKSRKIGPADETVISNSFKVGEAGKVVLTIDNQTSKKKKFLYRSKTNPIS